MLSTLFLFTLKLVIGGITLGVQVAITSPASFLELNKERG